MNDKHDLGVHRRRSLFVWGIFCVTAGMTFLSYALTSLANGRGEFVMPLDDVYIHFQYAKQIALGQFYLYNPGLPPTSGATSFLYPYLLAAGYLLGLQGLNLGLWAMGVGALALTLSMWLIYRLVHELTNTGWLAPIFALAFGLSGPVAWHFMSGMETGIVTLLVLGTLYSLIRFASSNRYSLKLLALSIAWISLLALSRPEGSLIAIVSTATLLFLRRLHETSAYRRPNQMFFKKHDGLFLLPIIASAVQPTVNFILTGSAVASGNAAKSILGSIPFDWNVVIQRIIENFVRIWVEFGTGNSSREGLYIVPLLVIPALLGISGLVRAKRLRPVGLMLVAWLIAGTLMIASLDTAFWHLKRYQMPFMILLFPLAASGIAQMAGTLPFGICSSKGKLTTAALSSLLLAISLFTAVNFLKNYSLNVHYVYQQPLQMARWLANNTARDAVVAVHDVGMMRYMGDRTTLDMVGLTTAGAADYWRNGPGSVAEYLLQQKPDYIASYGLGHGLGLGMIADTGIYGAPIASFPVELDNNANVALAAEFQGIYKPDWNNLINMFPVQLSSLIYLNSSPSGQMRLVDTLNVADIASERIHHFQWNNTTTNQGFPSVVRDLIYADCANNPCRIVDGGRQIDGQESFQILRNFQPGSNECCMDMLLLTRVHPSAQGTLDIYVTNHSGNEELVATQWFPTDPGEWVEIATLIPAEYINYLQQINIRIVPHVTGAYYEPYLHAAFIGHYQSSSLKHPPLSTFQNGAIQLGSATIDYHSDASMAVVNFEWYTDGNATGDYKVFVHLYDNLSKPPIAQADMRPGNGTIPPGNWLPGVLQDTITVDLKGIPPGKYKLAVGMYDPVTFERLQPTNGDAHGRLFIGEVNTLE